MVRYRPPPGRATTKRAHHAMFHVKHSVLVHAPEERRSGRWPHLMRHEPDVWCRTFAVVAPSHQPRRHHLETRPSLVNWRRGVEQSWLMAPCPKDLAQPRGRAARVAPWACGPDGRDGDLPHSRLVPRSDAIPLGVEEARLPTRRRQSPDAGVDGLSSGSPLRRRDVH